MPLVDELIEFQVDLGPVDMDDGKSKDVVVQWQMLDFDAQGEFYTDSNGLEM